MTVSLSGAKATTPSPSESYGQIIHAFGIGLPSALLASRVPVRTIAASERP